MPSRDLRFFSQRVSQLHVSLVTRGSLLPLAGPSPEAWLLIPINCYFSPRSRENSLPPLNPSQFDHPAEPICPSRNLPLALAVSLQTEAEAEKAQKIPNIALARLRSMAFSSSHHHTNSAPFILGRGSSPEPSSSLEPKQELGALLMPSRACATLASKRLISSKLPFARLHPGSSPLRPSFHPLPLVRGHLSNASHVGSLFLESAGTLPIFQHTNSLLPPDVEPGGNSDTEPTEEATRKLMLIDGNALVCKAYYAVESRIHRSFYYSSASEDPPSDDEPVVATVFAFLDILSSLLQRWKPSHVAVVFDHPGPSFREELYPGYKAKRRPKPDGLGAAFSCVRTAVLYLNLPLFMEKTVEADDVIATLAVQGVREDFKVRIVSPDKDFYQLLGPSLGIIHPEYMLPGENRRKQCRGGVGFYTFKEEDFCNKYSLKPCQFADWLALVGDKSDNIPGARGIGKKTALKLLREFGALENILKRADEVKHNGHMEQLKDVAVQERLMLFKRVVELRTDVALETSLASLEVRMPSREQTDAFWGFMELLEEDSVCMGKVRRKVSEMLHLFPQ